VSEKPDFFWLECPSCEWDCVISACRTELGLTCPMCAEDNGRDVWLRGGIGDMPATVEGCDDRRAALKPDSLRGEG
jgi:hypothetical protein